MQVVRFVAVIRTPDLLQQHAVRQHLVRVRQKDLEQVVFGRGEVDHLLAERHLAALEVQHEVAASNAPIGAGAGARDVPERDADPREELVDPERLRHVVVRTQIEGVHFVVLATPG